MSFVTMYHELELINMFLSQTNKHVVFLLSLQNSQSSPEIHALMSWK